MNRTAASVINSGYASPPPPVSRSIYPPGMLEFCRRAASSAEPVLLLGETGTGKTRLARLVHELGPRSHEPFRSINCGAVPASLFEREMFGHQRGAFTDARESQPGLFEAAHGGTLFLDEIGELPLSEQPKLLAALEDGRIRRLGSTREVQVNVRIMAATNADLAELVRQKRFRADLFHRLAVLRFEVAPLRKRRDELPAVIGELLAGCASPAPRLADDAREALIAYGWPGNLRELANALRHAVVFSDGGCLELRHFPEELRTPAAWRGEAAGDPRRYTAPDSQEREYALIHEALETARGNKTHAARLLGMSRSTLWAKLQRGAGPAPQLEEP